MYSNIMSVREGFKVGKKVGRYEAFIVYEAFLLGS